LSNFRKYWFILTSVLVIGLSVYGLLGTNPYLLRTNKMTTFEINGQDIVSLVIGVVIFLLSIPKNVSNHQRSLKLGCLVYISYTYAYYAFSLVTSKLYILYLVVLSISFFLLILHTLEFIKNDRVIDRKKYTNRSISIYIFLVVGIVGIMDLKELIVQTITNPIEMNSQIIFCVLDLALLFPAMVIAAYLNLKRRLFGIYFLGIFLVKTIALMPALILSDLLHYINLGTFVDSIFDIIAIIVLCSAIVFYRLYVIKLRQSELLI
jgi:hypothetical protein